MITQPCPNCGVTITKHGGTDITLHEPARQPTKGDLVVCPACWVLLIVLTDAGRLVVFPPELLDRLPEHSVKSLLKFLDYLYEQKFGPGGADAPDTVKH